MSMPYLIKQLNTGGYFARKKSESHSNSITVKNTNTHQALSVRIQFERYQLP